MANNKKEIIWNLDDYASKIIAVIADESQAGQNKVLQIIAQAESKYKKSTESWVKGWVYQYTRVRAKEVDQVVLDLQTESDSIVRLKKFQDLISHGEWNHGSFNYDLFVEIIKVIPGYNALKSTVEQLAIGEIAKLVAVKIETCIKQNEASKKNQAEKKKELEAMQHNVRKTVEGVLISNDLTTAIERAKAEPNSTFFCLKLADKNWKLSWVDSFGTSHLLEPNKEISALLSNAKIKNITDIKASDLQHLKAECVKVKAAFLEKTQVVINPLTVDKKTMSNAELIAKGFTSCFVVRHEAKTYRLWWVSSLGVDKEIPLSEYPQLQNWLNGLESVTDSHALQLKSYLLHVNTSKAIGMDQFKNQLSSCLGLSQPVVEVKVVANEVGHLDMHKFSKVSQLFGEPRVKVEAKPVVQVITKPIEEIELQELNRVNKGLKLLEVNEDNKGIELKEVNRGIFASVHTLFGTRPIRPVINGVGVESSFDEENGFSL